MWAQERKEGVKQRQGHRGQKGGDGGGEVCLGKEISPRLLQQKVSKGGWVAMSVLSSWRASSAMI